MKETSHEILHTLLFLCRSENRKIIGVRNQIRECLGAAQAKGHEHIFGVLEIFFALLVAVVIQLCSFVKLKLYL